MHTFTETFGAFPHFFSVMQTSHSRRGVTCVRWGVGDVPW